MPILRRRVRSRYRMDQGFGQPFTLNRASPQAKGLVAWWPTLGQGGNVLRDRSGYSNNGAISGAMWQTSSLLGRTLDYDGVNNFVSTSFTPPIAALPRTIVAWVQSNASKDGKIFWYGIATGGGTQFGFTTETISADYVLFRHGLGNIRYPGITIGGDYFHLAIVVPSGATRTDDVLVYIDGIQREGTRNAGTDQSLTTGDSPLYIGSTNAPDFHFSGRIASLAVFDYAKTAAEIWQEFAPQIRWDLYKPAARVFPYVATAAGTSLLMLQQQRSLLGGSV